MDMTTAEGEYAYQIRNNATPWCEQYYDYTHAELENIVNSNENSTFFHVIYTYQQLGKGEDYFKQVVQLLNKNWSTIRREVLLEWSVVNDNCPFSKEDLDIIHQYCKQPIREVLFGPYRQYRMQIFQEVDLRDGQIIGVDVSGGYRRDSSAITVMNAKTTEVMATLNCNYMPVDDLANCIYELVTKYLPNALVVIEKNGVGMGVLARLIHSSIKKNLFYTIKDQVLNERSNGVTVERGMHRVKAYGIDNSKDVRARMIELLFQRVQYHKDKFISPLLHEEMCGLTYKTSSGYTRVDHSVNTHDDQIFSYLMCIYVWYDCPDLADRFGITRGEIKTDTDLEEKVGALEDLYGDGFEEIDLERNTIDEEDPVLGDTAADLNKIMNDKYITIDQMIDKEMEDDHKALLRIMNTDIGRQAVADAYHLDLNQSSIYGYNDAINKQGNMANSLYSFYSDDEDLFDDNGNPRSGSRYVADCGNLFDTFNII